MTLHFRIITIISSIILFQLSHLSSIIRYKFSYFLKEPNNNNEEKRKNWIEKKNYHLWQIEFNFKVL